MRARTIIFPEKLRAELSEVEVADPDYGMVRVKNTGCGICQAEIKHFQDLLGGGFPKTSLGHEGIGYIDAVGPGVSGLQEGDLVTTLWQPAFQEFNIGRADWCYKLQNLPTSAHPYWISEPAACALNGLTAARVEPGDRVLIIGAGYMGLLLVQLFAASPVAELVVADLEPEKLALARLVGATLLLNPRETVMEEFVLEHGYFDVVVEATGAAGMIEKAASYTREGGRVVVFADHRHHEETIKWSAMDAKSVLFAAPLLNRDFFANWRQAIKLISAGKIDQQQLISHIFPAEQCQQAMEIAIARQPDYVKGYLSWV